MSWTPTVWDEISSFNPPSILIKEGFDPPDQRAELGHYGDLWKCGYSQGLRSEDGKGVSFEVPGDEDYKQLFANSK